MTGVKCSVRNCNNKYYQHRFAHYFRYPKNRARAEMWLIIVNRPDLMARKLENYRICSVHFEDKMFTDGSKTRLRLDAIPTLFLEEKYFVDIVVYQIVRRMSRKLYKEHFLFYTNIYTISGLNVLVYPN